MLNSNSIIEVGDNFIKYANGLLECWGRALSPGSSSGGLGYAEVSFPVPFKDLSYCLTATPDYNTSFPTFEVSVQNSTVNKGIVYTRQSNGTLLTGVYAYWKAVGRWK